MTRVTSRLTALPTARPEARPARSPRRRLTAVPVAAVVTVASVASIGAIGLGALLGPAAAATAPPTELARPAGQGIAGLVGTVATAASTAPSTAGRLAARGGSPLGVSTARNLGVSGVRDMLVAGGKVWVSTGNEVDVFSTGGKKLAAVTGLLGAADLAAAPDGSAVYVAVSQDARIATLDPATLRQTATWPVSPCPARLAPVAGHLFYSYGCDSWSGAVGSVAVADGTAGPVVAEKLYSAPWLGAGGSTLVSMPLGSSPATMTTYSVGADGTATSLATAAMPTDIGFSVAPDGSQVVITGGYGTVNRYRTADLAPAGTFAVEAWTRASAWAPDGSSFATGAAEGNATDIVRVFDATAATMTSHSAGSTFGSSSLPTVQAGTLQYSADGDLLYGLATPYDRPAVLVTATARSIGTAKVAATVTSPAAYGGKAAVRVTGRAGAALGVVLASTDGTSRTIHLKANSAGRAAATFVPRFNGTLTVTQAGDLRHPAATSARKYKAAARITLSTSGQYSSKGGLRHYHAYSAVRVPVRIAPERNLPITSLLQGYVNGRWVTATSVSGTVAGQGAYLYLTSFPKHVKGRFVISFSGDEYNGRARTVNSPTFVID